MQELVDLAKKGNQDAFEELLILNAKLIQGRIWAYWLPYGDRDDVAQEAYIAFHQAVMAFSGERGTSFEYFAKTVMDNRLKTALKKSRAFKHEGLNNAVSLNKYSQEGLEFINLIRDRGFDNEIDEIDSPFNVDELMQDCGLSKLEARIFKLYFIDDKTYEEIQNSLNCTNKTVDNALQRSRNKIRNSYVGRGCLKVGGRINNT